ncbi:MAG: family 78 glycoside hydrolase catalytic domain, partial [Clostridia bacterium]|nr:family 78 glycoside hydrolase catalytic domain [Clostridia bacterium]
MIRSAKWITSPRDAGVAAYTYRKEFTARRGIASARLYASAIGVFAPYINGKRVGRDVLAPGWTSYKNRVQYREYDITDMLEGENLLEIGLGQGWAVGCIGYGTSNHLIADFTSLIAALEINYEDGTRDVIYSDESFLVYTSHVTFSEIYHGETRDMTAPIELVGNAVLSDVSTEIIPVVGELITEQERLSPIELIITPKGERVIDFGQNMTGYVEVKIRGERGERIVIHHAEVLDREGNFYTANYRKAKNENTYILSGGDDVFKPLYTFQGFRYIRLTEYPYDEVDLSAFTAIAVNSDIRRTGDFICGNEKINQLYHNIIWGQKSNYLDIPTDCPQRDERLGWTGDAQVFCRTAAINFDVERFFKKWLGDVRVEQRENGAVMDIIPYPFKNIGTRISSAWGDVACIAPWQIYLAYGNREMLEENFELMRRWVEYIRSAGPEEFLWLGGKHYGDWLAMDAGEDSYVGATSNDLIASAFYAYSTELLVKAGEVLGYDMKEYRELRMRVVRAFREYFMEGGMPKEELPLTEVLTAGRTTYVDSVRRGVTQTALVLILHFGLCTEEERPALAAKLVELIRENGNKMTTGFVGTPYILHALSDNGYTDVAYELLFAEGNP